MVVNLQDADLTRPGQLAAAHQGEALDTATQSALAGTLVSSLHRLKDVDNTGENLNAPQIAALLNPFQTAASLCFQISPLRSRVISDFGSVSSRCSSKPPLLRVEALQFDECLRSKVAYIKSAISDPFTGEPLSSDLERSFMLKKISIYTTGISWHVRINLPLTLFW